MRSEAVRCNDYMQFDYNDISIKYSISQLPALSNKKRFPMLLTKVFSI